MNKKEIAAYAKTAKRLHKDEVVLERCVGKTVLDVGCIGQDRNYTSDNWLHNKIRGVATKTDGVDLLLAEIALLKEKGYSMYSVDELREMNSRYEVIVIADVIEHVDDPVNFLKFYSSFLSTSGIIIITTPNSNRANNFINILFNNNYTVNPEHTCWFCPRTFSEVVSRTDLTINSFFWAHHYFDPNTIKGFYQRFKMFLSNTLISARTNFSPNMIFILSKASRDGR